MGMVVPPGRFVQRLSPRFILLTNAIVFAETTSNTHAVSKPRKKQAARPEPQRELQDAMANAERVIASSKRALERAYELIEESRRARAEYERLRDRETDDL
jgi:hypothetical protein